MAGKNLVKATAPKKGKGGALASRDLLEKSLAATLQDTTQALVRAEPVASSANIIRTKNRKFAMGDETLAGPLKVVVLATAAGQFFYETAYDPEVRSAPVCFALAPSESELTPDPASPKLQNDGPCVTCKQNQPGSGDRGKFSRACGLRRRMAIMFLNDKSDDPQWASIELSVTAIKGWSSYVKSLAGIYNIPYFLAGTELDFEDDKSGDYWHLGMKFIDKLTVLRPDWVQPGRGVKIGSPGWFDTTLIGRKVKEINDTRALMVPPSLVVDDDKPVKGAKRRVKVGTVGARGRVRAQSVERVAKAARRRA